MNDAAVTTTANGEAEYTEPAGAKKGAAAECSRVEIEPTENGGFAVRKYYKSPPPEASGKSSPMNGGYRDPSIYAFSTFPEMATFLGDAFGMPAADPTAPA